MRPAHVRGYLGIWNMSEEIWNIQALALGDESKLCYKILTLPQNDLLLHLVLLFLQSGEPIFYFITIETRFITIQNKKLY